MAFFDGKTALTELKSQADFAVVTTLSIDKTEKDGKTSGQVVAELPHRRHRHGQARPRDRRGGEKL